METLTQDARTHTLGGRRVAEIRRDFPILRRRIGNAPLAYLDNAATSQKPRAVLEAIDRYYRHTNANVHRALHALGEEATAAFELARGKVRGFIGAEKTAEIVFTRGTTEAINLVASSWGRANLRPGDEVMLSEMEHHSNLVPWQLVCAERGCTLKFAPLAPDGTLDMAALEALVTERTRMVAITHVSNVLGTINDVRRIASMAHERGALMLVDGAQSVPHLPVDVRDLGCDFLAFSGHKMCAPMGIGVLWGRARLLEEMPPWMGGGEMIRAVWLDHATWNDLPWKFEAGTPNVEGAVGLGAAVDYLLGLGMRDVAAREARLGSYCLERLREVPGLTVYGSAQAGSRGAVYSFNLDGLHPHDVAQYLDSQGIAVRAGHHCAQPLMRALGVSATARASLSFYNTESECDRLREALVRARKMFG